jgi:hypothetical protein
VAGDVGHAVRQLAGELVGDDVICATQTQQIRDYLACISGHNSNKDALLRTVLACAYGIETGEGSKQITRRNKLERRTVPRLKYTAS